MANFELLKNMKKLGIVINGRGGVGKDTLCDFAAKVYRTVNVSSVDPIKKIASQSDSRVLIEYRRQDKRFVLLAWTARVWAAKPSQFSIIRKTIVLLAGHTRVCP